MIPFATSFFEALKPAAQLIALLSYVIPSAVSAAAYVILGLALASLCRSTGIGRVWMAWAPFANFYLLGLLADVYTDNRLTTAEDRAAPFYAPSSLRRKTLGYGIGASVTGTVTAVASLILSGLAALGLLLLLVAVPGMDESAVDVPPYADVLLLVSGLVAFAAGIFCLVLTIQFLIAFSTSLCRVLTALAVPSPALWTALGVFVPLAAAIVLLLYAKRAKTPAEAFSAPAEASDENPHEARGKTAEKELV